MESSYMKLYKDIASKKIKNKNNQSRQKYKQQLKKNNSLTYYHFDGQTNYINNFQINDLKINNKNSLFNNNKNNCKNNDKRNYNTSFNFFSNYEYNDNILFKAYKKSVLELFKRLKKFFNKEEYKYEKIKREFMNNIQKFYDEERKKEKEKEINKNKTPNNYNIKSYSKKTIKDKMKNKNNSINAYDKMFKTYKFSNSRKSNLIKDNSIKNKTNILFNNKFLNRSNLSDISFAQNKNNNSDFNSFNNHQSLYTLIKKNKTILENSPIKDIFNFRNDNIMRKFIKFSQNISGNKNTINKTCSQSLLNNKIITNNEKQNIIDNNRNPDKSSKNNEVISKIKDSVDDNLKHIFNFSYENFLNKETERECN